MAPEEVAAFVRILEVKDGSTAAHTWRVVLYTRALAEALDVDRRTIGRLTLAAALHDIGKIDIPDEILLKPARLTDDEFDVMRTHTTLGHERLVRMGEDDPIMLELVRHHHERIDGTGYPDRLTGPAIPAAAKYFSVVDTFDALTSVRPYRSDVGPGAAERAIEELNLHAGAWYSPDAVEAFTSLYRAGKLDWILSYHNDCCDVPPARRMIDLGHPARSVRPL